MGDHASREPPNLSRAHHSCYVLKAAGSSFSSSSQRCYHFLLTQTHSQFCVFYFPVHFREAMGLQVVLAGCLSQLLRNLRQNTTVAYNRKYFSPYNSGSVGVGLASDCRSGHLGQLCIPPSSWAHVVLLWPQQNQDSKLSSTSTFPVSAFMAYPAPHLPGRNDKA